MVISYDDIGQLVKWMYYICAISFDWFILYQFQIVYFKKQTVFKHELQK